MKSMTTAKNVFEIEADTIKNLSNLLTEEFSDAVDLVLHVSGLYIKLTVKDLRKTNS